MSPDSWNRHEVSRVRAAIRGRVVNEIQNKRTSGSVMIKAAKRAMITSCPSSVVLRRVLYHDQPINPTPPTHGQRIHGHSAVSCVTTKKNDLGLLFEGDTFLWNGVGRKIRIRMSLSIVRWIEERGLYLDAPCSSSPLFPILLLLPHSLCSCSNGSFLSSYLSFNSFVFILSLRTPTMLRYGKFSWPSFAPDLSASDHVGIVYKHVALGSG